MNVQDVQELIEILIKDPTKVISIKGQKKKIVGFAQFKTVNMGDDGYFKIVFDDHSFLLLIPSQNILMFTDEGTPHYIEIKDEEIGIKKELMFRGKKYVLDNANDYQYVIRLIVGDWKTIEGEVKFSDYVPEADSSELLSLGWIVKTGKRADVNPKEISIQDISVI
jgi:hypothetical protein